MLQFLLFLGRYFPSINVFTTRFAAWLVKDHVVAVDDSYRIFNLDCRVSPLLFAVPLRVTNVPPKVFATHDGVGDTL